VAGERTYQVDARAAHPSSDRRRLWLIAPILAFAAAALIGFGTHTLVRSAIDRDTAPAAPAPLVPAPDQKPTSPTGVRPGSALYTLPSRSLDADGNARRALALNDPAPRA
jgi:hypothetical protein